MVRNLFACTFGAFVLQAMAADVSPVPISIAPTPVPGKIQWVYSYAEGQQLARETGKPIFVVFRCER